MSNHKDSLTKVLEYLVNEDREKAADLLHDVFVEKAKNHWAALSESDESVEEDIQDEDLDETYDVEVDEGINNYDAEEDFLNDIETSEDEIEAEEVYGEDEDGDDMDMDAEAPEMDMDMDMDMDDEAEDEAEEEMESVEETEEVVREYKEKAKAPVTSEEGDGSAGPVAGKNDMGGKSVDPTGEEKGGSAAKATVQTDAADPKGATMSKA